jgi:ATP-dependent helicase/nuclease subunit B
MPLTLVTGPANAGKARFVLDAVRARVGDDPLLVVPTLHDADAYRRELAAGGTVFGPVVTVFDGLVAEIARRAGAAAEVLGPAQRDRLLAAAVASAQLETLAASAESPGFVAAAGELVAELQRELVTPQRFTQAMTEWGAAHGREPYAREVAALYRGYRDLLERLERVDGELRAWRALDALRAAPARWGGTPVFLYGFDDLTRLQREVVQTLAGRDDVDVTVALTYEPRAALAGRASTFEELAPLAARHEALEARPEYYESPALHHLERGLFEDGTGIANPGGTVRLLEAGGQRSEVELVAGAVVALLEEGTPPEQIAVVFRSPREPAGLVRSVFEAYGIPVAVDAPVALRAIPLGRGLLGLLHAALGEGRAQDVLAWLRTPGVLDQPGLADELETAVRVQGATTAAEARRLWEEKRWPLDLLDGLAGSRGPALLDMVSGAAERLLAAPRRRAAAVLDEDERLDAAALRAVLNALKGLSALVRQDPRLAPSPSELLESLERLEVRPRLAPGCVQVLDPLAIRARRVRALFACGLQEAEFPRPARPEPFLPDEVRRELAETTGLALRAGDDVLDDERALFYAVASRPEAVLGLSYRTSDEEGRPQVRSFFVDDVRDLFADRLYEERARRPLADVTWPDGTAPTAREQARTTAAARDLDPPGIAPLTAPAVREELASRGAWSAAHLEDFGGCPVQWLVDRYLRPQKFEPDSEPLARGNAAHMLLERTLTRLREEHGSARLDEASLPRAREILEEEIAAARDLRLSVDPARSRSVLRRLQADLLRYLRRTAEQPTAFTPEHLELEFGGAEDDLPALALDGLAVRGRIDRVDLDGEGRAAVIDYKGSQAYPVAKWAPDGRLQVALYMLAVRKVLGAEPVAGFYQATSGKQEARGVVREDTALAGPAIKNDRVTPAELDAVLADAASRAEDVARRLVAGALEAKPESCGWENKCQYPEVCRCER